MNQLSAIGNLDCKSPLAIANSCKNLLVSIKEKAIGSKLNLLLMDLMPAGADFVYVDALSNRL